MNDQQLTDKHDNPPERQKNHFRDLKLEIASTHSSALQHSRAKMLNDLLHDAREFMRKFQKGILRSDSDADRLVTCLNNSDEAFDGLSNFVSLATSSLLESYKHTIEQLLHIFNKCASNLEISFQKELSHSDGGLSRQKESLVSIREILCTEFNEMRESMTGIHVQKLSEISVREGERTDQILSSSNHTKSNLYQQKAFEIETYSAQTDPSRKNHTKLSSNLKQEIEMRHKQQEKLSYLQTKVDQLKYQKESLDADELLKIEKQHLLREIQKLKHQIRIEAQLHEKRLVHLASLHDDARRKIIRELDLIDLIRRTWQQCLKEGATKIEVNEATECQDSLRNITSRLLIQTKLLVTQTTSASRSLML